MGCPECGGPEGMGTLRTGTRVGETVCWLFPSWGAHRGGLEGGLSSLEGQGCSELGAALGCRHWLGAMFRAVTLQMGSRHQRHRLPGSLLEVGVVPGQPPALVGTDGAAVSGRGCRGSEKGEVW